MADATTGLPDATTVWAAVGNVKDPGMIGPEGGQPRRGTKHFRAGAKVFVIDAYWGTLGTVTVIGHHRKSGRVICIDLPTKHIENPRAKLVYSPTVRRLVEEHFGAGRGLPDKEYADRLCGLIAGSRGDTVVVQHGSDDRPPQVKIDLAGVTSARELHERLAAALGFPAFYGHNWDAFWDAITGLVAMPRRLVIHGWRDVEARWPADASIMVECLRDLNAQHPASASAFELRPEPLRP